MSPLDLEPRHHYEAKKVNGERVVLDLDLGDPFRHALSSALQPCTLRLCAPGALA